MAELNRKIFSLSLRNDVAKDVAKLAEGQGLKPGTFVSRLIENSIKGIFPCKKCGFPHPHHVEVRRGK
jgi:hypothetical protein